MLVFSAFPIANLFLGLSTKDYGLWYQVGLAVRQGLDIYPRPETGRLFPFMYPPSAAAMLAWVSMLGSIGSLLVLLLVNSAAWVVCIWLSVWLAAGPRARRHPLVVIVPSLSHHRVGLQCLPVGSAQPVTPGTPVGVICLPSAGAADRRRGPPGHGRGHQGVPDPGPRLSDLPADVDGLGCDGGRAGRLASARPTSFPHTSPGGRRSGRLVTRACSSPTTPTASPSARFGRTVTRTSRSWHWRTACCATCRPMASRSCRDGPRLAGPRPLKGLPPIDPSTDLLTFLKPHAQSTTTNAHVLGHGHRGKLEREVVERTLEQAPRWEDSLQGAEPALRTAWRVNIADLSFRAVTAITLAVMLALSPVCRGRFAAEKPPNSTDRCPRVCSGHLADRDILPLVVQLRLRMADLSDDAGPVPGDQRIAGCAVAPSQGRLDHRG